MRKRIKKGVRDRAHRKAQQPANGNRDLKDMMSRRGKRPPLARLEKSSSYTARSHRAHRPGPYWNCTSPRSCGAKYGRPPVPSPYGCGRTAYPPPPPYSANCGPGGPGGGGYSGSALPCTSRCPGPGDDAGAELAVNGKADVEAEPEPDMDVGAEADMEAEAGVEIGVEVDGEEEAELGLEAEAGAGADGSYAGAETNVSQPVNQSGSQGVSQTDQQASRSANERRKNRPSKRVYAHARTTRDGRREDGDRTAERGCHRTENNRAHVGERVCKSTRQVL